MMTLIIKDLHKPQPKHPNHHNIWDSPIHHMPYLPYGIPTLNVLPTMCPNFPSVLLTLSLVYSPYHGVLFSNVATTSMVVSTL